MACTAAKVIPKPIYVCKTEKSDCKIGKQIPTLKIRNSSWLVCNIDHAPILTLIFPSFLRVLHQYFTGVTFSAMNTFRGKSKLIILAIVIDGLYLQVCQNSIENFQELKQWICKWPYLNFNDHRFLKLACVVNVV